eukprot:462938-Ditylum_brightwellii.AAC.1
MSILQRSSHNHNTTTSSASAEDNGKSSEEEARPVSGQESASSTNATKGSKRSSLCCNNKIQETRETTDLGDPRVDAPDKTTDKTNKSAEQDKKVADNSGGGELPDISNYKKRCRKECMYKLYPKDGYTNDDTVEMDDSSDGNSDDSDYEYKAEEDAIDKAKYVAGEDSSHPSYAWWEP